MIRKNRKRGSRYIIQRNASPEKIAYYVQRMLEKKMETKEIIYIISSQFGDDVREFAKMYRYCFYMEDVRHIANLIYNIPKKNLDKIMDT